MSNSFTPASMNFQPRPQVCHPPPPPPPPVGTWPDMIIGVADWEWMDDVTFIGSTRSGANPVPMSMTDPGVYQGGYPDDQGRSGTMTVELAHLTGDTHVTIVLEIPDWGTLIMTAVLGPWDGSDVWTLGPTALTFSDPTGTGETTLSSQDDEEEPPP